MRIAVIGSGGVGGFFGARLAKGGADVAFLARGAHLAALHEHGLRVEGGGEPLHLPRVEATDDPARIGRADLVMLCVKLWDTEEAARRIQPLLGEGTAVVSFQNGVTKDEVLRCILPEDAVFGGVAYVAAAIGRPGVIMITGPMQRLVFGEFDRKVSPRTEAFLAACRAGAINAELSPDITGEIWRKFVFLVGLSGATAAMRLPVGPIREHELTRRFLLDLMRETVAVGRARGIALPADFADQRLAFIDGLPAEMKASMCHDLERGNRLELLWLSGAVVTLGEAAGVPTPANRAVRDILVLHADGHREGETRLR